jgi:NADPH:quinone reductase-like Zn-dependent oxidoreductase
MKAIVYHQYGSPEVLKLEEIKTPEPKSNEVLIRIKATAVNSGDCRLRKADPFAVRFIFGLFKPRKKILGTSFSGIIESVGSEIKKYNLGDEVWGSSDMLFGTYAEYICLPEDAMFTLKPQTVTFTEAASIPFGANTALHFLQKANIRPGQEILIYGASGAVGSAAVQLAKYFGATVTAVCSTANIALVKDIGADYVLDYTQEDFMRMDKEYDFIWDTVNKLSPTRSAPNLKKDGQFILSAAGLSALFSALWLKITKGIKSQMGVIKITHEGTELLSRLMESGQLKPVIDKVYTLENIPEAHTYADQGHKKGNLAITI